MPRFDRLSAAFIDDPDFQQVLGLFYADILEFHRRAYKFFRRHGGSFIVNLQIIEMIASPDCLCSLENGLRFAMEDI